MLHRIFLVLSMMMPGSNLIKGKEVRDRIFFFPKYLGRKIYLSKNENLGQIRL